jgi:hypothetical protein
MPEGNLITAQPWRELELTLEAARDYPNAYTEMEVWAEFKHDSGKELVRPAFWDGGHIWKVRFASPFGAGPAFISFSKASIV